MPVFAVRTAKGPSWDYARGNREQAFWDEHAAFADRLVERGVIILGGPIASDDEEDIALLAVEASDEDAVRAIFDADPWTVQRVFRIKDVRAWALWLDGRSRQTRLGPVINDRAWAGVTTSSWRSPPSSSRDDWSRPPACTGSKPAVRMSRSTSWAARSSSAA